MRNNPLKYVDPDGHNPLLVIAVIGAILFFSQIPSDQYQADPSNQGNPYVMAAGGALMFAPALGPALCLNDGDCTNEITSTQSISQQAIDAQRLTQNGQWIQRNEFMSDAARAYQQFISGRTDGKVFSLNGYTFDGYDAAAGILKDAKAIPLNLINTSSGKFYPWVSGTADWLKQAQNQINASGGLKIQWYFDSQAARDAMYNLFLNQNTGLLKKIDLIFKQMQ